MAHSALSKTHICLLQASIPLALAVVAGVAPASVVDACIIQDAGHSMADTPRDGDHVALCQVGEPVAREQDRTTASAAPSPAQSARPAGGDVPVPMAPPTPREDEIMLSRYRATLLLELGLVDEHKKYLSPSLANLPRRMGSDDEKRKWVFALAMQKVQLALVGMPIDGNSQVADAVRASVPKLLGRVLQRLTPLSVQAVSRHWAGRVPGVLSSNPEALNQAAANAEVAARVLVEEYLSLDKASAYESAPLLRQADMLLETAALIVSQRAWPTAYALYLNDTSGGYQGREFYVGRMLGKDSTEYRSWPSMTPREQGAALKRAWLAGIQSSRDLAHSRITSEQWERTTGTKLGDLSVRDTILLAGGNSLWEHYSRATVDEQGQIFLAAALKSQAWIWMVQAAL